MGDIQGCLGPLQRLLEKLRFDPARDRLWLVGDLVNRGPQSLETLRFVRSLGAAVTCVLGNHDLHLLAVRHGVRRPNPRDTLREVVDAPDGEELLDWVRHLPLLHRDPALGTTLVHAGIYPSWSLDEAASLAREVEGVLRGPRWGSLIRNMYGDRPRRWDPELSGHERARFIINAFTRMRFVGADGALDFAHTGPPGSQPAGLTPWFEVPGRASAGERIAFGHWSALPHPATPGLLALDSGCVWGNRLSAVKIDGTAPKWVRVAC